jgi:hypothetical protein
MNLMVLINGALMFYRNFGLRHVNAALGFAIRLAALDAGREIIARFAKPLEWPRSRLAQVPETSVL